MSARRARADHAAAGVDQRRHARSAPDRGVAVCLQAAPRSAAHRPASASGRCGCGMNGSSTAAMHGDERQHAHHFKQGKAAFGRSYSFFALVRFSMRDIGRNAASAFLAVRAVGDDVIGRRVRPASDTDKDGSRDRSARCRPSDKARSRPRRPASAAPARPGPPTSTDSGRHRDRTGRARCQSSATESRAALTLDSLR